MPRRDQGWITFQVVEEERQLLEEICQQIQRTKTEVLRELVRGVGQSSVPVEVHQNQIEKQPRRKRFQRSLFPPFLPVLKNL